MTALPDSATITPVSQNPSPASHCYLLTNSSANLQNCLDIVATQGAYLVPRAGTPVFEKTYDAKFAAALEQQIRALIVEQTCRSVMYRGAADEWPIGHTPPEMKEKRNAELKAQEEIEGATSEDSSDNDNDDNNDISVRVEASSGKTVVAPGQADWLPTPPLSSQSPLATPHRRKRRRISEEGHEEMACPTKMRVSSTRDISATEDAIPNTLQCSGRKRRRILDMGDEEEGKELPTKVRITTTGPSSRRLQKLRPGRPAN